MRADLGAHLHHDLGVAGVTGKRESRVDSILVLRRLQN